MSWSGSWGVTVAARQSLLLYISAFELKAARILFGQDACLDLASSTPSAASRCMPMLERHVRVLSGKRLPANASLLALRANDACALLLEGTCAVGLAAGVVLHTARLRCQALTLEFALRLLRPLLRRVGTVVRRGYAQRPVPARRSVYVSFVGLTGSACSALAAAAILLQSWLK